MLRFLQIGVLMTGLVGQGVIFGSAPPVLPAISEHFGGGVSGQFAAQMMMSLPAFGLMGGGLLSGWIIVRAGPRPVLLIALFLFGVFGAAPVLVDDLIGFLASRLALGIVAACLTTACATLLVETLEGRKRVTVIGYQSALGHVFGILVIYLAGFIVQQSGWRASFLIYAGFAAAGLAMATTAPRSSRRAARANGNEGVYRNLRSFARVGWILTVTPMMYVILGLLTIQLPFLLREDGLGAPVTTAVIVGMVMVSGTAASAAFGRIEAVLGGRNIMSFALAILGSALLLIGVSRSAITTAIGALLGGLAGGVTSPFVWQSMMQQASVAIRDVALGLMNTAVFLGMFLNPFVATGIQQLIGVHMTFIAMGLACLAAFTATLLVRGFRPTPSRSDEE